jgi:hypothetical protein
MRFFPKRKDETAVDVRMKKEHGEQQQYDDPRLVGRKRFNNTKNTGSSSSYPDDENWHPRPHKRNDQPYGGTTPFSADVDDSKKKESFTELVRKLNCAAPRKEEIDVQLHRTRTQANIAIIPLQKRTQSWVPLRKGRSQSDITRPVIITVKDGDLEEHAPCDEHKMGELKSTFIIGEMPTKVKTGSPFRIGMSARNIRSPDGGKSFTGNNNNNNNNDKTSGIDNKKSNNFGGWRYGTSRNGDIQQSTGTKTDSIRTAEEIARRERWRRGLEMEQRMWKGGYGYRTTENETEGDDSTTSDHRTQGSHTTGVTGEYSSVGPDTLTTITDTDESSDSDDIRCTGIRSRDILSGPFGVGGTTSCREYAVHGVAEDLGIVARLLLSDGGACLGVAAAITRETVANCREGKI